jgi:hypothetical protein
VIPLQPGACHTIKNGTGQSLVVGGSTGTTVTIVNGVTETVCTPDGVNYSPPGGGGTVTSVSVATANGFQGSSSGGIAPILTLNLDATHVLPVITNYNLNVGGSIPSGVTGQYNTAVGLISLANVTSGGGNTAVGYQSLDGETSANDNTAVGTQALYATTTGSNNVGIGTNVLYGNTTGTQNVAIGFDAGYNLATMSNSVFLGAGSGSNTDGLTNVIAIGYGVHGTASNQVSIGGTGITSTILQGVVQAGTSVTSSTLTLSGSGCGAGTYAMADGTGCGALVVSSPPTVTSNIDGTLTGWKPVCTKPTCNPGGVDTPASTSQTINNTSPSLDGNSMFISSTTNASSTQTNALWSFNSGPCDSCTSVTSDFQTYITNGTSATSMEYDSFIFDATDSLDFMWGTQCNRSLGYWQIANNSSDWQTTSAACSLTSGAWHHIVESFHRVPGETSCTANIHNGSGGYDSASEPCLYFDSISVDGTLDTLNVHYPGNPLPGGWTSGAGLQFQIDIGATTGTPVTVSENLDSITYTKGGSTTSYLPLSGGVLSGPLTAPLINGMSVTAIGVGAGTLNLGGSIQNTSTGANNLAIGPGVLNSNSTGYNNVGIGQGALYLNTTGSNDMALGLNSLNANTTGSENAGIGQGSLAASTTGSDNTGVGKTALAQIISSSGNTAIGAYAGYSSTTPMTTTSYSTFIGENANDSANGFTNNVVIGYNAQATVSNQVMMGNSDVTQMCFAGGRACWYSSSGTPSSGLCTSSNIGSLYSSTDGSSPTSTLYVCTSAGVWTADPL